MKNAEDVLAAVGRGEMAASDVLRAMGLEFEEKRPKTAKTAQARKRPGQGGPKLSPFAVSTATFQFELPPRPAPCPATA